MTDNQAAYQTDLRGARIRVDGGGMAAWETPDTEGPAQTIMTLSGFDTEQVRQWFDALQDINPTLLEPRDYELAQRIYEHQGRRVPLSISRHTG